MRLIVNAQRLYEISRGNNIILSSLHGQNLVELNVMETIILHLNEWFSLGDVDVL